jgi:hypothetical protein
MGSPEFTVKAFTNDFIFMHNDTPNHRIGRHASFTIPGNIQTALHEFFMDGHAVEMSNFVKIYNAGDNSIYQKGIGGNLYQ